MTSKRRAVKPAANLPEAPAREGPITAPATSRLDRLVAWLKTLKGAIVAIAGIGAVLGGLAGYWNAYQAARGTTESSKLLALVGKGDAGPLSIVVLPFANLTGDPQQAYLADGMTAAITSDLSRIRDAFIVSTATAFAYKDKPVTVQQIGKELGVRFALQGGVQRSGDKIRINAQLADTTTSAQLWSESFDGESGDSFALQEMVTVRIGNSIGREMVIAAARDSQARIRDPKVTDLLLRARALDLKPMSLSVFNGMETLYRQVLNLEPQNVQAMLGIARSMSVPAFNGFVTDPVAREKQLLAARDLALKARDLHPTDPKIFDTLSEYAASHGDPEAARRALEVALSLDPKNRDRYCNLADDFIEAGEPVRAIELLTQGIRLDPKHLDAVILDNMGRALFMKGDNEAAIKWLLKAIDANATYVSPQAYLAMAYAQKGDGARARAAAATLLRTNPDFRLSSFQTPKTAYPVAYREYWEAKLLPAGRLAGLPE